MKYAIYGINRISKDFLYIFDQLNVVCFFENEPNMKSFLDLPVFSIDELKHKKGEFDKIIICDIDKEKREKIITKYGFIYKKDYVYEEDLFSTLNCEKKEIDVQGKKLLVWGTGQVAKRFIAYQRRYEPDFYIDSYRKEKDFDGKQIKKPEEIDDWEKYYIIIAVANDNEIRKYLSEKNLEEEKDYINAKEIMYLPSEMLRATIFDTNCYNLECSTMLNHIELLTAGSIFCCCSTFVGSMGNLNNSNVADIWNSVIHKILCLSLENKTYTFCNKNMCPLFIARKNENSIDLNIPYKKMERYPKVVAVGFDSTCNLKCETCRDDLHIACGEELKKAKEYAQVTVQELLPHCEFLIMAGDGEVFASQSYKDIYISKEANNLKYIRLLSNGMLFNERNWEKFSSGKKGKIMLTASVDAATKETYEMIRRNGNFDVLRRNMLYAAGLRKKGELSYFRMNFVVQKRNYKEMPRFVEWGLELGADEVFFTKVLNWGTYTAEQFNEISMMKEDGITPKAELQKILEHPLMKNDIVDLGTIQYSHKIVEENVIENYYKWELERKVDSLFI